jgi:TM2 domain-containing membrane protein YozV
MNLLGAKVKQGAKQRAKTRTEIKTIEINVLLVKKSLDHNQLSLLNHEFNRHKKNLIILVLLWLFLGVVGGHRFYTRDYEKAIGLIILGWATLFIWNAIDIYFASKQLERLNNGIEFEIIHAIRN